MVRPRDGASCALRCAVMPISRKKVVQVIMDAMAVTFGWDGHVNAISSGSCGRRCPLSPSCPTPSATGAVALIALLCAAVPMAERVTGGRPQHGRVGKSSATREELEEAESTHHTAVARGNRGARLPRRCSTGFLLADARDVIARVSYARPRPLPLGRAHRRALGDE